MLRETAAQFENPALLFSGGKDSIVMAWLARKAFWPSKMPFPLVHVDTGHNFVETMIYRDEFVEKVAPLTAHLHLGDAQGLNGEGLQIGQGDLDFARLGKILRTGCPQASFIPEIWQGHKNGGEGFWIALEKLEGLL